MEYLTGEITPTKEVRSNRRKTSPTVPFYATNTTYTHPGSNAGLRSEKPASHCKALRSGATGRGNWRLWTSSVLTVIPS